VFVTLLAAAAAAAAASHPSYYTNQSPPQRFQRDTTVQLQITGQDGIDRACHKAFGAPPPGMKTDACEIDGRVIAPNPCSFPADPYARLLCHEIGHANGWPASHGD
jgi:hypothetical protein